MRLWTIQPLEVFDLIIKTGCYQCNAEHPSVALGHDYEESYDWLVKRMKEKIGNPPENVKYPVWAWHTRNGKHKKPDLRCSGYAKRGTPCVLMEIEIPDNQVVLTDFDAWHYVLNDWYFDNSTSEEEWDKKHAWYDRLSKSAKEKAKEKSWLEIFNIDPFNNRWAIRGECIQAVFWELKAEQIIKHWFFTAK